MKAVLSGVLGLFQQLVAFAVVPAALAFALMTTAPDVQDRPAAQDVPEHVAKCVVCRQAGLRAHRECGSFLSSENDEEREPFWTSRRTVDVREEFGASASAEEPLDAADTLAVADRPDEMHRATGFTTSEM
jgi:hypothetical protein